MLTRQYNPPVDRTHIVIVLGATFLGPAARAAQREWHAVPGNRRAIQELLFVLRVDFRTLLDGRPDLVFRGHRGEAKIGQAVAITIAAKQYGGTILEKAGRGIRDIGDRLIGIADAAIDAVIFLPKAALELHADLE